MRCLGSRYKMSNGCGHSLSSQTLPANMAIQLSKKRKIIANHIDALIDEGSESFSCYPHRHIQTFGPSSTICNNLFDGIPFNLGSSQFFLNNRHLCLSTCQGKGTQVLRSTASATTFDGCSWF
ncbi:unnamed protein product [Lactuca virosa]|uniref:Uncharacterized protein n=1 Tax=Lactuca virosa TaxID=75947 RepID=A0AAU9MZG2_9ASTR|nr:unnamed protein product [Lactuca virosa]